VLDFEGRGWRINGIYHSHPRYPARPSKIDLELADMPGVVYLITSVRVEASKRLRCETRAWQIEGRRVFPVEIVLVD
jgi:proteasome lid subunit RPN8/RPN11